MPCLLLVAALLAAPAPATLPDRYMPVDEIRPGMKGVGKTVLEGTEIVEFGVEVIGVLRNVGPRRDMILVRCSGQGLEKTGIIGGMSGSPIYIDGKLIGALAYGWQFAKSPIAGLTPIGEMLRVGSGGLPAPATGGKGEEAPRSARRAAKSAGGVHRLPSPLEVNGRTYGQVEVRLGPVPGDAAPRGIPILAPLVTPVMASGLGRKALARLGPILRRRGMMAVPAGSLPPGTRKKMKARLEPGSVCAVSLVTGDAELTAIGTVTERVGDVVWAFGHPFYGEGKVEMPLSTGAILTVLPSQMSSFKFGVALQPAGAIVNDETAGIRGLVGKPASTVPLEVLVRAKPARNDRYLYNLMRHPEYTPRLFRLMVLDSLFARSNLPRECHLRMEARLEFAGREPVKLRNFYSGFDGAYEAISRVYSAADALVNNDIKPVRLERGRVLLTVEKGLDRAFIESLRLDTPRVKPGGTVQARVVVRPYRGEREVVTIRLALPPETPEGTYRLVVCNAASAGRIDLAARPHRVAPRTLDDLFSLVAEEYDNRHLYARLELPEPGVAFEGRELPRLPAFALEVFRGTRWSGVVTPLKRVLEAQVPTRWILLGREEKRVQVSRRP